MNKNITVDELRTKYLEFFKSKNHAEISGKSLIPEHDPTVLFTTAGMHPLVPYLMGEPHPAGTRLTDCQKCVRTGDIDAVGDDAHLTFFEMLGNWSLGDYFKDDSIRYSFEFLTDEKYLGIDPKELSITVFEGDEDAPRDEESAKIWERLGIRPDRIFYMPKSDNWWGPAGETGPCGPDTEIFLDTGKPACGDACNPGCDCGKYFEIWNNVFMQYYKNADGTFTPLERKCVDTGMGVERTVTMLQGKKSVYEIESFVAIINKIESLSGKKYHSDEKDDTSIRIIADHIRTASFMIGDPQSVFPSNVGAGYVLRRIIRRAVRHGKKIGIDGNFMAKLAEVVIEENKSFYTELLENKELICNELTKEEDKFLKTLKKGEAEFEKLLPNLLKSDKKLMPGRVAFKLYDTFGFPIELTEELARESGLTVDREGFDKAFQKHQEMSRAGSEKKFKGGLADHSQASTEYHTATHLLHEALRRVLGTHVHQRGSNITAERLRFDFCHPNPMTAEEKKAVEDLVNKAIQDDLKVSWEILPIEEAKKQGALAIFGERYEETVKIYRIGDFSIEVCGGPHVESTGSMGKFVIKKEQSSSAGIRRIKAILEK